MSLLVCPCGRPRGSAFCRCGRTLSAVAPLALGAGAVSVRPWSSRHAPSGLVASCFFRSFAAACVWAKACPALFGVVPPRVRRSGHGWLVRVPVSSCK